MDHDFTTTAGRIRFMDSIKTLPDYQKFREDLFNHSMTWPDGHGLGGGTFQATPPTPPASVTPSYLPTP